MLGKLVAIGLTVFVGAVLIDNENKKKKEKAAQQEDAQKQAETAQATFQDQTKSATASNVVAQFLVSYNGCLPVHAEDWSPFTQWGQTDWHYIKDAFSQQGSSYATCWDKIHKWSNKTCKTGFYSKEFASIEDALYERRYW